MRKKLATMLLVVVMAVGLLPLSACGGTGETPGLDGSETPKQSDTPETTEPPETAYIPKGDVLATGEAGESVTWSFYSDGTLVISGTGPMEDYTYDVWGGTIDDVPWGDYCDQIYTVILNGGVTSIGEAAFAGCRSLTDVTIPDSVTSIGEWAFYNCHNLTSVTIPDSVTSIEEGVFAHCTSLTSVTIPDSVTSIGDSAFLVCTELTSVTIPASVTSIEKNAFDYCDSLTDIYYGGISSQWKQINIGVNNDPLLNATIHYNS